MHSIDLVNCEFGACTSRKDGSVAFRVITAELRPSEAGLLMQFTGKAVRVAVFPHGEQPSETVTVDTDSAVKTPSERLRAILFVLFKHEQPGTSFDEFYRQRMEQFITHVKTKLPPA